MLYTISSVIDAAELQRARELLGDGEFVDGRLSAGDSAQAVKHNRELNPASHLSAELNELVLRPLFAHPVFQAAVLPHRLGGAFYARYEPGMDYGEHVDDAIMGADQRYRADVSITVFLNSPEHYGGGELCIGTAYGEQKIKLPAGDAVAYPSASVHRVAPVTRGERLVAVTWAQSMVRSAERRSLLYDIYSVSRALHAATPKARAARVQEQVYNNLIRMWADL